MSTQHHKTVKESLTEAAIVCQEIGTLVSEENDALEQRNIKPVEENLKRKGRLAAKLERLLNEAKARKEELKNDAAARDAAKAIQIEMDSFQDMARKNLLLLKSAHQVRSDTLRMIHSALNNNRPQAQTYNARGQVSSKGGNTSLVNKSI